MVVLTVARLAFLLGCCIFVTTELLISIYRFSPRIFAQVHLEFSQTQKRIHAVNSHFVKH